MAHLTAMESMFSDKLNINYVPSDDEVAVIKRLLVEPDQKLHSITGEIEEIKAQLERLLKEKEDLNGQLKAHKALLSPARRLPSDVVRRIFLHCLPIDRNPVLSSREAPLLLGRISSHWRDIALAAPELWAAIHIAIPGDPPYTPMPINSTSPPPLPHIDHATRIQAITSWLTRSDPYPLSISVYNARFDNVTGNPVQQYLDTILSFMPRWKHIHMSVPHQVWNNFLPRVRAGDVPSLEKIYLESAMGYHGVPGSPGTGSRRESGLLKAPNLRSVSLILFEPHVLHLPLRWSRLTDLNLSGSTPSWQPVEGLSITETLAVLTLCPNLEYFSIQLSLAGFTPLASGDYGLPKVTLNKLMGLAVTEINNTDSAPFFSHLTTPKLRQLKFRRSSPNLYMPPPDIPHAHNNLRLIHIPLAMFIRRVNSPIEELELDAVYMNETDVMRCLSLLPKLKKLSLWSFGSSSAAASPYATPTIPPWENTSFIFEDRHLRRFVPGLSSDEPDNSNEQEKPTRRPSGIVASGWGSWTPSSFTASESPPLPPLPDPVDDPGNTNVAITVETETASSTKASNSTAATNEDAQGSTQDETPSLNPISSPSSSRSSTPPSWFIPRSKNKGKSRATDLDLDLGSLDINPLDVLCPLLEDFYCSGAMFSDATMLAFLRARSSLASKSTQPSSSPAPSGPSSSKHPAPSSSDSILEPSSSSDHALAHLRRCKISFSMGREQLDKTKAELEEIRKETGMLLDVYYHPMPVSTYYRRYSPYEGLPTLPVMGAAPGANFGPNVNTVTTFGSLGSGDPVFLHGPTFH